ncbi:MAG: VanZ family protein [Bacteroidales bacterium]|nr:VanZ family protein [Bacteroidales bacterium]
MPGNYIPHISNFWEWISIDKLVHLFIFGVLVFLILYGFRDQYFSSTKKYLFGIISVVITSLYGMITEILQHYVFTGRSGNRFDFYADATGALIGWLVFYLLFRKKNQRLTKQRKIN